MTAKKFIKKNKPYERLTIAKAEKFELENEITRGSLVFLEDVAMEWKALTLEYKAAFSGLASALSKRLLEINDPNVIFDIINAEINRINHRLAKDGDDGLEELKNMASQESDENEDESEEVEDEEEAPQQVEEVEEKPKPKRERKKKERMIEEKPEEVKEEKEEPDMIGDIDIGKYKL